MEWITAILVVLCVIATVFKVRRVGLDADKDVEIKSLLDKIKHRERCIKSLREEVEQLKKPIPYATTWYRDGQGCVTEAIPKCEDIAGAFRPVPYSGQLAVKTDKGIRMNENYVKPVYASNWAYPMANPSVAGNQLVAGRTGRYMASDSGPVLNLDNWDFITGFAGSDLDSRKPVVSDVCESTPSHGSVVEVNDCSGSYSYDSGSGSCDSSSSCSSGGDY
jgi:hypothetical protein